MNDTVVESVPEVTQQAVEAAPEVVQTVKEAVPQTTEVVKKAAKSVDKKLFGYVITFAGGGLAIYYGGKLIRKIVTKFEDKIVAKHSAVTKAEGTDEAELEDVNLEADDKGSKKDNSKGKH